MFSEEVNNSNLRIVPDLFSKAIMIWRNLALRGFCVESRFAWNLFEKLFLR